MKHLCFTLSLTCGLLGGTLMVATAQDSSPQHQLPSPPVSRPEISPLPVPAGPFGVGRIGYEWIDASRVDIHSADPLKHRDLMVYLWSPSLKGKAGEIGEYLPGAKQMDANSAVRPVMQEEFGFAAFPENPDGKWFTQPVLLLEVDHSGQRRGFNDAQNAEYLKKKEVQLNKCPAGSYDVLLKSPGLVHASFSDYRLLAANGESTETELALHTLRLTESFILAFLDQKLKQASEPLLDGGQDRPEATVTRYGR